MLVLLCEGIAHSSFFFLSLKMSTTSENSAENGLLRLQPLSKVLLSDMTVTIWSFLTLLVSLLIRLRDW